MKKNEQVTDRKRARRQQNKEIKDKILKTKVQSRWQKQMGGQTI